jgi:YVTN family beta-propeller protein
MINKAIRILWVGVLMSTLAHCIKEPAKPQNPNLPKESSIRVAVLCEGNYLWNNAQLDVYYPDSNILWSDAFTQVNQRQIGDVLHSGLVIQDAIWLVVNNSGNIVVLDKHHLKVKQTINISKSPRYLTSFGGKIYVSDLESNAISIYDTATQKIIQIPVLLNPSGVRSGWTEHIEVFHNKIVAAVYDGFLWVFDPIQEKVQRIAAPKGTQYLAIDKNQQLWVASTYNDSSVLTRYDSDFKIIDRYELPKNETITRLKRSVTGDTLWMLVSSELQGMDVRNPGVRFKKTVPYTMGYGLGVNPWNGDIYMSDAYDYLKRGRVAVLNASADSVKADFFTGIIPSEFVFMQP